MRRHASLVLAFLLLSTSASATLGQFTVNLGLDDFAELGDIKDKITSTLTEISSTSTDVNASINYINLVSSAIGGVGGLAKTNNVAKIAQFTDDAEALVGLSDDESIQNIADTFSFVDVSPVRAAISMLQMDAAQLAMETNVGIPLPDNDWFTAGVTSGRARTQMSELRDLASNRKMMLETNAGNVFTALESLGGLSNGVLTAERAAHAGAERVLMVPLVGSSFAAGLLATESSFLTLRTSDIPSLRRSLNDLNSPIESRLDELDDLINAIDQVLDSPTLSSQWNTAISDQGGARVGFTATTSGENFTHPTTEIEGKFKVGTIELTNLGCRCLDLENNPNAMLREDAELIVTAQRSVELFGETLDTFADVPLQVSYISRDGDDFLSVTVIDKFAIVAEGESDRFDIFAQYDSPLRIVDIAVSANSTGFGRVVESIVPEPSSALLLLSSIYCCSYLWRANSSTQRARLYGFLNAS